MKNEGGDFLFEIRRDFSCEFRKDGRRKLRFERGHGCGLLIGLKIIKRREDKGSEIITRREFFEVVSGRGGKLELLEPNVIGIDFLSNRSALGLPAVTIGVEFTVQGGGSSEGKAEGEETVADALAGFRKTP